MSPCCLYVCSRNISKARISIPTYIVYTIHIADSGYWCLANINIRGDQNEFHSLDRVGVNGKGIRLIKIFILRKLRKTSTYGFGFDKQVKMFPDMQLHIMLYLYIIIYAWQCVCYWFISIVHKRTLSRDSNQAIIILSFLPGFFFSLTLMQDTHDARWCSRICRDHR